MKINYGVKIKPPSISTARAFGSEVKPILLPGGQETSYASGHIVLKPAGGTKVANWTAEIFNNLPEVTGLRFTRPIRSIHGTWIHDGYVAFFFLKGKHVQGKYVEKLKASRKLHALLKNIKKSDFLMVPHNSWAAADLVALGDKEFKYDKEFMDLYDQIKPHLKPLSLKRQLVHGDLSWNFLFDPKLPIAIIDFSPTWAPNGFAEAIMLADAIVWEKATSKDLEVFKKMPHMDELAWRGVLRRIAEQAEHMKWFSKDKKSAVKSANEFQRAINYLKVHFNA